MSTYFELLKHPRWQRKSAETKIRAGWVCQVCGRDDATLEVHHGFYRFGRDPWQYPDESLFCLCVKCHSIDATSEDTVVPISISAPSSGKASCVDSSVMVLLLV